MVQAACHDLFQQGGATPAGLTRLGNYIIKEFFGHGMSLVAVLLSESALQAQTFLTIEAWDGSVCLLH